MQACFITSRQRRLGLAALALAACLWGSNHVVARAMRNELPLTALVFWRWSIALALLLPFAWKRLRADAPVLRRHAGYLVHMGIVGVGIFSWAIHAAAYNAPATEVGLLSALTPVWALLIAAALGMQRPGAPQVLGVATALFGAVLVLTHGLAWGGADPDATRTRGQLLALLAGVAFAWYGVQLRHRPAGLAVTSFIIATALAGTLLVALPMLLVNIWWLGAHFLPVDPVDAAVAGDTGLRPLLALLYIAAGPTLAANLLWAFGTMRVAPTTAASFLYLMPVSASALSILFLGETFHWYHVAGVATTFSGIALADRRPTSGAAAVEAGR